MDAKRAKEVFSDEAFVKSLFEMEAVADAQAALKGRGLDVTQDELMKIRDQIAASANQSGDMDEEQLKEAAGGVGNIIIGPTIPVGFEPWLQNPQPIRW